MAFESALSPVPAQPSRVDVIEASMSGADLPTLFRENYAKIWRYLFNLGVPSERIADAVQQVFLIYAERQHEVLPGKERPFLFGVATKTGYTVRRVARREVVTDDEDWVVADTPGLDELADRNRARVLLQELLDRLSPDLREVFVLYEIEEVTLPEIAEALDIPVGTATSRLRRARERFSTFVKRYALSVQHNAKGPFND